MVWSDGQLTAHNWILNGYKLHILWRKCRDFKVARATISTVNVFVEQNFPFTLGTWHHDISAWLWFIDDSHLRNGVSSAIIPHRLCRELTIFVRADLAKKRRHEQCDEIFKKLRSFDKRRNNKSQRETEFCRNYNNWRVGRRKHD